MTTPRLSACAALAARVFFLPLLADARQPQRLEDRGYLKAAR